MRNHAFLKVALLGLLAFALMPGYAAAGQDLSEMLSSSAAVHATAVSGPILTATPLSHDYGVVDNTLLGPLFFFQLKNTGDQDLNISVAGSGDAAFSSFTGMMTLPPGGIHNLGV